MGTNNDIQLNQKKLLTLTCIPLLLAALSEVFTGTSDNAPH